MIAYRQRDKNHNHQRLDMSDQLVSPKEYGAKRRGGPNYNSRGGNGSRANPDSKDLVQVYNETKEYCRMYETQFDAAEAWSDIPEPSVVEAGSQSACLVVVVNNDTLSAIEVDGDVILIMGSDYKEGGGVKSGARAQEENVYRRCNIHLVQTSQFYTNRLQSLIYFPKLELLRDAQYNWIAEMSETSEADVKIFSAITAAAIRNPRIRTVIVEGQQHETYARAEELEYMKWTIDNIFKLAILKQHRRVILGALGCGAYHNPAYAVRDLFQSAINRYRQYFDKITFAVYDRPGSEVNNFDIFKSLH